MVHSAWLLARGFGRLCTDCARGSCVESIGCTLNTRPAGNSSRVGFAITTSRPSGASCSQSGWLDAQQADEWAVLFLDRDDVDDAETVACWPPRYPVRRSRGCVACADVLGGCSTRLRLTSRRTNPRSSSSSSRTKRRSPQLPVRTRGPSGLTQSYASAVAEKKSDYSRVDGGKIEIWKNEDGLFGVTLLPDEGQPGYPGFSCTSAEGHTGFPETYDAEALKAWGQKRWSERTN